jgi:hypothetical protein
MAVDSTAGCDRGEHEVGARLPQATRCGKVRQTALYHRLLLAVKTMDNGATLEVRNHGGQGPAQ